MKRELLRIFALSGRRVRVLVPLALAIIFCAATSLAASCAAHSGRAAAAQSSNEATQKPRQTSTPYTGDLSVFDYPGRDAKLQVQRVMDILGIHSGSQVADIGAGSGWFTVRAAKRVGPSGWVYAEDINPEAIRYITARAKSEGLADVKAVLGTPDNPLLPAASLDAVLILKSYHEVARPVNLLENLCAALRPQARVGIIDRNGTPESHGVDRDIVVKEAGEAGYRLSGEYNFVKKDHEDYFLVFQAQEACAAKSMTHPAP